MGSITGGSGGTDDTYENVKLTTSGSGKGAEATIVVASNVVDSVTITKGGSGYATTDTVSAASGDIGGVSGFSQAISTVSSTFSDTALPAHINLSLADFMVVCQVRSVSLDLSREELDTTALPCSTSGSDASCDAPFRTTQSGYTSGSGTMEVMFTSDQGSQANRLLASSLRADQSGAMVKLYIDTVAGTSGPDDTQSMFISGPITLLGFSLNVTPGEVTTATVNFTFSGQPTIDLSST